MLAFQLQQNKEMKSCSVINITFVIIFVVHNIVYNNFILLQVEGPVGGGSVLGSSTIQVRDEKNCTLLFNLLQLRLFEFLNAYFASLGHLLSKRTAKPSGLKANSLEQYVKAS